MHAFKTVMKIIQYNFPPLRQLSWLDLSPSLVLQSRQQVITSYLVPVLLCAPSCLVLVVQCEPQSPEPFLKKGDGEVSPQRDRYVMERLVEDYFERGEGGKKRRRDWVILSERRGYERQTESKSFSQLLRDRLFHLNCVLRTSEGL